MVRWFWILGLAARPWTKIYHHFSQHQLTIHFLINHKLNPFAHSLGHHQFHVAKPSHYHALLGQIRWHCRSLCFGWEGCHPQWCAKWVQRCWYSGDEGMSGQVFFCKWKGVPKRKQTLWKSNGKLKVAKKFSCFEDEPLDMRWQRSCYLIGWSNQSNLWCQLRSQVFSNLNGKSSKIIYTPEN